MKKVLLLLVLFIILVIGFIFLSYQNKKTPLATINNHTFNLEIAKSEKDQEIGLSKYKNISSNFGMLFLFEKEGYYSFWMKNMKFPIDIIFIKNGKIVKIFSDVPFPKSSNSYLPIYKPDELSDTVLEINAGLSKEYNFQKNDTVIINY